MTDLEEEVVRLEVVEALLLQERQGPLCEDRAHHHVS